MKPKSLGFLLALTTAVSSVGPGLADDYQVQRQAMVSAIEDDVIATSMYIGKQSFDPAVMNAMASVPRHEFVPKDQQKNAYENRPLPIGYGQTISQPYIVALMTDLLDLSKEKKVLEIGTGSGYQAAILNQMTPQVFTIEIIKSLGERAIDTFKRLQLNSIQIRIDDGYYGWEAEAPFDAIVVTAAVDHVPPPLVAQLKKGGRMVIPVGSRFFVQQLVLVTKDVSGNITTRQLLPVRFVPLTGTH